MHISLHIDNPGMLFAISEEIQDNMAISAEIGHRILGESCIITHSQENTKFLSQFYRLLSPMKVKHVVDDSLSPGVVRFVLNIEEGFNKTSMDISSDNLELIDELVISCLDPLGVIKADTLLCVVSENKITAQEDSVTVQALRWWMRRKGILTSFEKSLFLKPTLAVKEYRPEYASIRSRMPLTIHTDNMLAGEALMERLEQSGFHVAGVMHKIFEDQGSDRIGVNSPWFGVEDSIRERIDLANSISQFARDHEILLDAYPVMLEHEPSEHIMSDVFLPFDACRERRMCAYGGTYPDRLSVRIETDSEEVGKRLFRRLQGLGIRKILVTQLDDDDRRRGHSLYSDELPHFQPIKECICAEMRKELDAMNGHVFSILTRDNFVSSCDMVIRFPAIGIGDGTLLESMGAPRYFNLMVCCQDTNGWEDCIAVLKRMGFANFYVKKEDVTENLLKYGMAPVGLRKKVVDVVTRHGDIDLREEKIWDDADNDLWVYLPVREAIDDAKQQEVVLQSDIMRCYWEQDRFAEVVSMVTDWKDTHAPCDNRWIHLVPLKEQFCHYCLTGRTLAILRYVLKRVDMGEPCLLEGVAATSKTTAILFLAALLGQPVVRINLNEQTDTGELIGKFVLDTESKQSAGWKWQEGISLAMHHGFWILLDQMDRAAPQVLERLNSVLEMPPSLVVSEYDNSIVGGSDCPVHPNFRIFATTNLPSFVGRNQLSRSYVSRWVGTLCIPEPDETECCQILQNVVFGGERWGYALLDGEKSEPPCVSLQAVPQIRDICDRLGRFHSLVVKGEGGNGVVSLRSLLALTYYLAKSDPASFNNRLSDGIVDYYVVSAHSSEESQAIILLAQSCNLLAVS